jgi:hypothetical protein
LIRVFVLEAVVHEGIAQTDRLLALCQYHGDGWY